MIPRGRVYIVKTRGHRTEPCGTPAEVRSQNGDTRPEANKIATMIQRLYFVFNLNVWDQILQTFHIVTCTE